MPKKKTLTTSWQVWTEIALSVLLPLSCSAPIRESEAKRPQAQAAAQQVAPPAAPVLLRSHLRSALKLGMAALWAQFKVVPEVKDGTFRGFRVQEIMTGPFQINAIRVGDVVTAVNGVSVDDPTRCFTVWQGLETAPRLDVDLVRGARVEHLVWSIVEDVP